MSTSTQDNLTEAIRKIAISGDLSKLDPDQKLQYYTAVCESLGLNPLTQPLAYITLNGKLTLYAKKDATDQLRRIYDVSVLDMKHVVHSELGLYVVTSIGSLPTGRKDTGTGAVSIKGLTGDSLANGIMKAETKAKRRMTLSICGLGMLDETELDTVNPDNNYPVVPAPAAPIVPAVNHTPAVATEAARPNEEPKKASPKKESAKKPEPEAPAPPPVDPQEGPNGHGLFITDDDVSPLMPEDNRLSTAEERKAFAAVLDTFTNVTRENLKAYLLKFAGVSKIPDITYNKWSAAIAKLNAAKTESDESLATLVNG